MLITTYSPERFNHREHAISTRLAGVRLSCRASKIFINSFAFMDRTQKV